MNPSVTSARLVNLQDTVSISDTKSALWVFGYGSLCWNPGFNFTKAVMGNIKGYSRKFWQGNNTHRGTEDKPGRVATLVKDEDKCVVHGVAFQIMDEDALNYLQIRECQLGGYITELTTFYPVTDGLTLTVILYIATCENSLWLGDASLCDIAKQITFCSGPSGYNAEYLLRLANFIRNHFPGKDDQHLFELERLVKLNIEEKKLCYKTLMGCEKNYVTFRRAPPSFDDLVENLPEREDVLQFTARMPDKTLRCLNM